MAWTTPSTKTTGALITAAIWNEQVANNAIWLGTSHDHSGDAGDGATLSMPSSGMIVMFNISCPAGWTRVTALDDKMIRGAAAYGGSGGSDTHVHSTTAHTHSVGTAHTHAGVAHVHGIAAHQHDFWDVHAHSGTHLHGGITVQGGNTYESGIAGGASHPDATATSGTNSADTASGTTGTGASGGAGTTTSVGGNTAVGSTLPAYLAVVFCKKD